MEEFQVSVEAGQGLERLIRVNVPAGRIDQEVEARLRSVSRTASLRGYRPGKVPEKVIRQRFGEQVRRDVLQDLVQASYSEAVSREKLRPAGTPRIDTQSDAGQQGNDLTYTASIEVFPEFQLVGLNGLAVQRPEADLGDGDVEFVIDGLRRQRATWVAVERASRDGDRIVVDFQGELNGQPMPGGQGEDVAVVLGEGRMIADFERQLVGLSPAEERSIDVGFPADYPTAALAGQTARFAIKVREVTEEQLPEVDQEFIRALGIESGELADFHVEIRRNMEQEFASRAAAEVKKQLLEALLAANPIVVPAVLVEQEAASLQADAMRNLGVSDPQQGPGLDSFRETAERRVRLGLLIGAVIRENQIQVDRERVSARIDQLSQGHTKPDEIRKIYHQTPHLLTQVENAVLEEQVIDWLTDRAKVTPRSTSFQALVSG